MSAKIISCPLQLLFLFIFCPGREHVSSLARLFSGSNFQYTIKKYCGQIGWKIANIDNKMATLMFTMNSGRDQILIIYRYESTLEFSVPSIAVFPSEESLPHYLSTILMRRNSEKKFGFWCIEETSSGYVYSIMHNAELELMNVEYFSRVVQALIRECDDFEGILLRMMK